MAIPKDIKRSKAKVHNRTSGPATKKDSFAFNFLFVFTVLSEGYIVIGHVIQAAEPCIPITDQGLTVMSYQLMVT